MGITGGYNTFVGSGAEQTTIMERRIRTWALETAFITDQGFQYLLRANAGYNNTASYNTFDGGLAGVNNKWLLTTPSPAIRRATVILREQATPSLVPAPATTTQHQAIVFGYQAGYLEHQLTRRQYTFLATRPAINNNGTSNISGSASGNSFFGYQAGYYNTYPKTAILVTRPEGVPTMSSSEPRRHVVGLQRASTMVAEPTMTAATTPLSEIMLGDNNS